MLVYIGLGLISSVLLLILEKRAICVSECVLEGAYGPKANIDLQGGFYIIASTTCEKSDFVSTSMLLDLIFYFILSTIKYSYERVR